MRALARAGGVVSLLGSHRILFLERPHPLGYRGALCDRLVPLLRRRGALVEVVHAELGLHRLDIQPRWDLVVLKSGSAAALHLAAAVEAWGIPCLNPSEATRLAQDKIAIAAIIQRAGLPIAPARVAWLGPGLDLERLSQLADRALVMKGPRGSQGAAVWSVAAGELAKLAPALPPGPYLLTEQIPHAGPDLKVFVAGEWLAAVERRFPARTLAEKRGRRRGVPDEAARVARAVGGLLELTCYGCDFVAGPNGWTLVDVNAFPGYKGADDAPEALVDEVARALLEASS